MEARHWLGTVREAARRLTQALMLLVPARFVAAHLWRAAMFPHDDHPWVLTVVLVLVAAVPLSIWWREASGSALSRRIELGVFAIAATAGFVLFAYSAARMGFLLTSPYSGPMAVEGTLFLLIGSMLAAAASLALAVSPLLLDSAFFSVRARRRAWRAVSYAAPLTAAIAVVNGERLARFFA